MRYPLQLLLTLALLCSSAFADPIAPLPRDLKLTNGATLRNVSILRWRGPDLVVLKHAGGAAPVRLEHIAEEHRAIVASYHGVLPAQPKPAAATATAEKAKDKPVKLTGEAFARGIDQPYLFAGMPVTLHRAADEEAARIATVEIKVPPAVARTTTDSEGKFTLTAPPGKYTIRAQGRRQHRGARYADYEWIIPVTLEGEAVTAQLTGDNAEIDAGTLNVLR